MGRLDRTGACATFYSLQMDPSRIVPPGQSNVDPWKTDIDPVAFAVDRVICHATWIAANLHGFVQLRQSDPTLAEQELRYLAHSSEALERHAERLRQLLLAGYTINPSKRLPPGLDEIPIRDFGTRSDL